MTSGTSQEEGFDQGKPGIWGWIQGSRVFSKVAETSKSAMDSVITTLDPQMKDFLAADAAVELAIASDKEVKINSVKEGFQRIFSQVVARGLGSPGSPSMANQPLGFENGRKAAEERIASLRNSGLVPRTIAIVAVEGFVFEASPDRFFFADCVILDDPSKNLQIEVISQAVQIPPAAVGFLKAHTPGDYPQRDSGFAVTVGQAVAEATGFTPYDWQEQLSGAPRRKSIESAAVSVAFQYRAAVFNSAGVPQPEAIAEG